MAVSQEWLPVVKAGDKILTPFDSEEMEAERKRIEESNAKKGRRIRSTRANCSGKASSMDNGSETTESDKEANPRADLDRSFEETTEAEEE